MASQVELGGLIKLVLASFEAEANFIFGLALCCNFDS